MNRGSSLSPSATAAELAPRHRRRRALCLWAVCAAAMGTVVGCATAPPALEPLPATPDTIDAWIAEQESHFPGITPGAEKTIHWAGEPGERTTVSIIYIHGWTATRQETAPVSDRVAEALGANLFYTRLNGHGLDGKALGRASVAGMLSDTEEAWQIGRMIGERVIVIATSTGAPLASWLAAHVEEMEALIMMSPNFAPARPEANLILWPGGLILGWIIEGFEYCFEPRNELNARFWTTCYPTAALRTMMQVVQIGNRQPLESIEVPTLFIYTETDTTVSIPALKEAYERFGSPYKQIVDLPGARRHVIAGHIISPWATDRAVDTILAFLDGTP